MWTCRVLRAYALPRRIARTKLRLCTLRWGFLGVSDPFGDFELIFGVSRLGLKICETPTRYMPRVYGSHKTRFFKHGSMLVRTALSAVRKFKCT